jgi:ABC-type transport system involved in multi-copper enzyme maturation permease subunit
MRNNVKTIAYYTFKEATQNRLFRLTFVGLISMLGIAEFTGELAITETREIQAVLLASIARWFLIITSALFVITSMVREFNDKGAELILSLPISKMTYYFGKFFGFFCLSLLMSLSVSLLLLLYADYYSLIIWTISLICETSIIISMSMLCMFTFNNITVSFVVVICFYILCRSISAIQLLSTSPILDSDAFSQEFIVFLVNSISYVLPALNEFTKSDWLAYGVEENILILIFMQTLIYLGLLFSAGIFDLSRKEL